MMKRLALWPLVLLCASLAHAQAPSGYSKLTGTPVTGTTYIPNTSVAHSVVLTWNAVPMATGYNVYREQVLLPSPPVVNSPVVQ